MHTYICGPKFRKFFQICCQVENGILRDTLLSRYSDINYVLSLPIDDFLELYATGLEEIRVDKMWLAYCIGQYDGTFEEFCGGNKNHPTEQGIYIDQIGF